MYAVFYYVPISYILYYQPMLPVKDNLIIVQNKIEHNLNNNKQNVGFVFNFFY